MFASSLPSLSTPSLFAATAAQAKSATTFYSIMVPVLLSTGSVIFGECGGYCGYVRSYPPRPTQSKSERASHAH